MNIMPTFKPLYPAIKRFCNLCGKETGTNDYETQSVRDMEARMRGGELVICDACGEHAEQVSQIVGAAAARWDRDQEEARSKFLRELAQEEMDKRMGKPLKKKVGRPKKKPENTGTIPNPKDL